MGKSAALAFVIVGCVCAGFVAASYRTLQVVMAQPVGYPYGGQIGAEIICICSGNSLLREIGPPRPGGVVIYPVPAVVPGAGTSYMWYMHFLPGAWTLGLGIPGGVCLIPAVTGCMEAPLPLTHTSLEEGTGLMPGAPAL